MSELIWAGIVMGLGGTLAMDIWSEVLARGTDSGVFRSDVDPQHLYITIASICYFPVSNRYTLSAIFKLQSDGDMLEDRRRQAVDVIFGYLRP